MIVTMTTVGYGDYYATSDLGRLIIFFVAIWGVFVVALMVMTLTRSIKLSSCEIKAITVLNKLQLR